MPRKKKVAPAPASTQPGAPAPRHPRDWCTPKTAFGKYAARRRDWNPPAATDPRIHDFRAAVHQHAIVRAVREAKRDAHWSQRHLAALDGRVAPEVGEVNWKKKLNGWDRLTQEDISVIHRVFAPEVLPDHDHIRDLLSVAENGVLPSNWREVDRKTP